MALNAKAARFPPGKIDHWSLCRRRGQVIRTAFQPSAGNSPQTLQIQLFIRPRATGMGFTEELTFGGHLMLCSADCTKICSTLISKSVLVQ